LAAFLTPPCLRSGEQVLLVNPVPAFSVISLVADMIHCRTGQLSIILPQIKLVAIFNINQEIPVNGVRGGTDDRQQYTT